MGLSGGAAPAGAAAATTAAPVGAPADAAAAAAAANEPAGARPPPELSEVAERWGDGGLDAGGAAEAGRRRGGHGAALA